MIKLWCLPERSWTGLVSCLSSEPGTWILQAWSSFLPDYWVDQDYTLPGTDVARPSIYALIRACLVHELNRGFCIVVLQNKRSLGSCWQTVFNSFFLLLKVFVFLYFKLIESLTPQNGWVIIQENVTNLFKRVNMGEADSICGCTMYFCDQLSSDVHNTVNISVWSDTCYLESIHHHFCP